MFCQKCGANLVEGATFCSNCGTPVAQQQAPVQQAPVQQVPVQQVPVQPAVNTYGQPVVYVKPKTPGRGLGIAGMVLGIIAAVAIFGCWGDVSDLMKAVDLAGEYITKTETFKTAVGDVITNAVVFSILSILAIIFGASAKSKGYKSGVRTAALILGTISLVAFVAAIGTVVTL